MPYYLYPSLQRVRSALWQHPVDDAIKMVRELQTKYASQKNQSFKAQMEFYTDLSSLATEYYDKKIYQTKSIWGKIACIFDANLGRYLGLSVARFFGVLNHSESVFLEIKEEAQSRAKAAQAREKKIWALPLGLSFGLSIQAKEGNAFSGFEAMAKTNKDTRTKIKVLSHRLMGKHRLGGDDVEGINPILAIYKTYTDLCKFQTAHPELSNRLESTKKTLLQLFHTTSRVGYSRAIKEYGMTSKASHESRLADLHYEVTNALSKLEVNQAYVIPSGFTSKSGGHGVVVEFRRKDDLTYDMTFINTGGGLLELNWVRQLVAVVSGSSPAYVIENLTMDELTNTSFISDLLRPIHEDSVTDEEGERAMLAPLKTMQRAGRLKTGDDKFPIQRNGTCAHSSIQAWLLINLGKPLYDTFRYFSVNRGLDKLEKLRQSIDPEVQGVISNLRASRGEWNAALTTENRRGMDVLNELKLLGERQKDEIKEDQRAEATELKATKSTALKDFAKYRKAPQKPRAITRDYIAHLKQRVQKLENDYVRVAPKECANPPKKPPSIGRSLLTLFTRTLPHPEQQAWKAYHRKQKKLSAAEKVLETEQSLQAIESLSVARL